MKRIKRNNPTEEAAIQRGIAADPDAAEWTKGDFARAQRASDVMAADIAAAWHSSFTVEVSSRRKRK